MPHMPLISRSALLLALIGLAVICAFAIALAYLVRLENQLPAIHEAARLGDIAALDQLLQSGVPVDSRLATRSRQSGSTPLMWAAAYSNRSTCDFLISRGANLGAVDSLLNTALMWAAINGKAENISALCLCGPDVQNHDGATALHLACSGGHATVVEELLTCGASLDIRNTDGDTAFHCSVFSESMAACEMLLRRGMDIDVKGGLGRTLLMEAAAGNKVRFVDFLIERGASAAVVDDHGFNALELSIMSRSSGCASLLIDAMPSYRCSGTNSPVHLAVGKRQLETLARMVQNGWDIDCPNELGMSPLMLAINNKNMEAIVMLDNAGASWERTSNDGRSILDMANGTGQEDIIAYVGRCVVADGH